MPFGKASTHFEMSSNASCQPSMACCLPNPSSPPFAAFRTGCCSLMMDVYRSAGYTDAQLEEVRHAIRHQVKSHSVLQAVQQLVSELQLASDDTHPIAPDQALEVLEERGLVDKLARCVTAPPQSLANAAAASLLRTKTQSLSAADGHPHLHVKLLGARALVDYVAQSAQPGEHLQLCVELMGHRLCSDWVPACPEPTFSGELLLPLSHHTTAIQDTQSRPLKAGSPAQIAKSKAADVQDALALLALRHPLHIVIVSSSPGSTPTTSHTGQGGAQPGFGPWPDLSHSASPSHIVAVGAGDWRTALLRRRPVSVSVQLRSGPGIALGVPGGSAPAGLVTLQLSVHPTPGAPIDEPTLQVQQRTEAARDTQRASLFLSRAKSWWASFVGKSSEFKTRPVKVMSRGEDGAYYPSCSFIRPLQLGRGLQTPRQAARFVSLLRSRDEDAAAQPVSGLDGSTSSSSSVEAWSCLHTILSSRSGSSQELALLLCSLLLGFGLDAYVCVGRRQNGAGCMWVMTRAAFAEPTLWDPATGMRYTGLDQVSCPFMSVGSVFNHCSLYANCQAEEGVLACSYLLEEPGLWQELQVAAAEVPGPGWSSINLSLPLPPEACCQLEQQLEVQVKQALAQARPAVMAQLAHNQRQALDALAAEEQLVWDVSLEHLLMPALEAYEQEAVTGEVAPGSEDFSAAIKRATPLGWVFKGVPQAHRHAHAPAIAAALLEDPEARDVLAMSAQGCWGLRVKVVSYPEGLLSTWVMLACKAPSPSHA